MIRLKWRVINGKWTTQYLGLEIKQTRGIKKYGSKTQYTVSRSDTVLDTSRDLIQAIAFCHRYKPKKVSKL